MQQSQQDRFAQRIYIMDLDGTMMPSAEIDNLCYWNAVSDVFGNVPEPADLRAFENVSDAGVLLEWSAKELGREPGSTEIEAVRERFLELTEQATREQPELFRACPGLEQWLERVASRRDVAVGIATGGWEHTARLKLAASGLDRFAIPLASSDDAVPRTGIMRCALDRVRASLGTGSAISHGAYTVYVGDAVWDFEASRNIGWEFIGIAKGPDAARLKAAGAAIVFPNFRPLIFDLD